MKSKKYSLIRNIIFHLKSARQWNKWVCYFQFLDVIPNMSATFLGVWLPSLVVSELQRGVSLKMLMESIITVSSGMLISKVINAGMTQYLYRHGLSLTLYYDKLAVEKTTKIDYDLLESKDVRKLVGNVWDALRKEFAIRGSVTSMPVLIISVFNSVLYARAVYKDAPFVIMDEPTAALDPEAETEIFEGFDKMVGKKTAIYISHRLASCRFCEDILVFDDGKVVQHGSHDELEKQEGLYRELWNGQAQYYTIKT